MTAQQWHHFFFCCCYVDHVNSSYTNWPVDLRCVSLQRITHHKQKILKRNTGLTSLILFFFGSDVNISITLKPLFFSFFPASFLFSCLLSYFLCLLQSNFFLIYFYQYHFKWKRWLEIAVLVKTGRGLLILVQCELLSCHYWCPNTKGIFKNDQRRHKAFPAVKNFVKFLLAGQKMEDQGDLNDYILKELIQKIVVIKTLVSQKWILH